MIGSSRIRTWKAIATLAAILAVLLLLLPQAANHHAPALVFLFVPLFLFAELIDRSIRYEPRTDHVVAPNQLVRSALFQRPPPAQA
jgi:phosphatidylglycerophosphate synthase